MQKFDTKQLNDVVNEAYEKSRATTAATTPTTFRSWPRCLRNCSAYRSASPTERSSRRATRITYSGSNRSRKCLPPSWRCSNTGRHDPTKNRGRRDRTAVQLDHGDPTRERPSLDPAGQCRSHHGVQHGQARRQFGRQMEIDHRFSGRTLRQSVGTAGRTLQIGIGDQFQQPIDRLAAEKLQSDLRRSRYVAGYLHPPVLDGRDRTPTVDLRRHDRQPRRQPGHQEEGLRRRA